MCGTEAAEDNDMPAHLHLMIGAEDAVLLFWESNVHVRVRKKVGSKTKIAGPRTSCYVVPSASRTCT